MKGYEAINYLKLRRELARITRFEIGLALQSSRTNIALIERKLKTTTKWLELYAAQFNLKTNYFIQDQYDITSVQYSYWQRLGYVRKELNISVKELVARTGIDTFDIYNIENGKRRNTKLSSLERLANGLNVEPIAFYDIENKVTILYPEVRQELFSF